VIEGQGVLLRLDKSDWDKYPAAQAVVLLQDESEEIRIKREDRSKK
jgi:hypothetical protein